MSTRINVDGYRTAARKRLPRMVFDFIDGGAEDERTLRANRAAFTRRTLTPRLLSGSARRTQETILFGEKLATPVLLAPTGLSRLAGRGGELAAARGARAAGTQSVVSSAASVPVDEVAAGCDVPPWFQLYPWGDWDLTRVLIDRARLAGCTTLVVTLDVPVTGARERDYRNGMTVPVKITPRTAFDVVRHPRWALGLAAGPRLTMAHLVGLREDRGSSASSLAQLNLDLLNAAYSWEDLRRVRDYWDGPLLVKGVLGAADARRAVQCGADGVIVSNHGGRQADAVPASLDALPGVVAAVGHEATVLMDGGVRRGTDVVMAVALGARAVLIGRPWMYGLAVGGETGVTRIVEILRDEVDRTLALMGVGSTAALTPDMVRSTVGATP
ncbi:alpha-hydroxy acid oxidase [Tsukamurella sp. 8F]|uniref:alpha-hydroxy acid oxidase n=1 Tax=unclassified Tsukamurella TaxID=2633480 RepID=UPI0023B8E427|nr:MULTISPECIES: alpha-hydroxy acid oxidase [unclassified Tsukamurella]MDF0528508.1 alpha-hydroxy acid oxidase [Tsukamurella sp. 8J]MDF0586334.1 alpha-hydroxy acid oxidase [Tsukamurella sp. 8F]